MLYKKEKIMVYENYIVRLRRDYIVSLRYCVGCMYYRSEGPTSCTMYLGREICKLGIKKWSNSKTYTHFRYHPYLCYTNHIA